MERITKIIYLFMLTIIIVQSEVGAIREYKMEYYCGNNISLIFDEIYQGAIELDAEDLRSTSSVCEVNIESWYSWPYLMFYMEEFELDCRNGHLELLDGLSGEPIDGLNSIFCGTNIPKGVFSTKTQFLKVRYTQLRRTSEDDSFSLIFTSFSTELQCFEHKCKNDRCIHKDIVCGGYNPCGDDKDCEKGLTGAAVAGIVIGSLLGLAVLVGIGVYVCCRKNKKSKPPQGAGNRPVVYTANPPPPEGRQSYPTAYQHPAYIGNHASIISAQQPAYPVNFTCPIYQEAAPTAPPPYSEIYPDAAMGNHIQTDQQPRPEDQNKQNEQNHQGEKAIQAEQDYSNVTTLQVRGFREHKENSGENVTDKEYAEPTDSKGPGYGNLNQSVDGHEYSKCEPETKSE